MAVPTIASLTPSLGLAQGKNIVSMVGTDFAAAMTVTINGVVATRVTPVSATQLFFTPGRNPQGTYDVVIQNLDVNGDPVAGETATLTAGYTHRRPFYDSLHKSIYARIAERIVAVMSNDLIANVKLSSSQDFDPVTGDGSNFIDVGTFPAIALFGPRERLSRLGSKRRSIVYQATTDNKIKRRRARRKVDLVWDMVLVMKGDGAKLGEVNLMAATRGWFDDNGYLDLDVDPTDPSNGFVRYPMGLESDLVPFGEPNASDVRNFRGTFAVMNLTVEDAPGMVNDSVDAVSGRLNSVTINSTQQSE